MQSTTKEEEVVDLAKYGDNPDPNIMTSPEKRKYKEILFARSDEVLGRVAEAAIQVRKVKEEIQTAIDETVHIRENHIREEKAINA
jgi:hypothetical protein